MEIFLIAFALILQAMDEKRDIEWLITTDRNDALTSLDQTFTGTFTSYRGTGLLETDRHPVKQNFQPTHIWIGSDDSGRRVRGILATHKDSKTPTASTPGMFVYVKDLPNADELIRTDDGNRLQTLFGASQGFHDAYGHFDENGNRVWGTTASWRAFTVNPDKSLRIISMFVLMEGDGNRWRITHRNLREGTLTVGNRKGAAEKTD